MDQLERLLRSLNRQTKRRPGVQEEEPAREDCANSVGRRRQS